MHMLKKLALWHSALLVPSTKVEPGALEGHLAKRKKTRIPYSVFQVARRVVGLARAQGLAASIDHLPRIWISRVC